MPLIFDSEFFRFCESQDYNGCRRLLENPITVISQGALQSGFEFACEKGNADLAEMIYDESLEYIDLTKDDDYIFMRACSKNRCDVADMLESLLPDRYKVYYDDGLDSIVDWEVFEEEYEEEEYNSVMCIEQIGISV
tara:strand:- start:57 stop:467 length:411 start_codon:yes stop_codon:yes gene_type:complete